MGSNSDVDLRSYRVMLGRLQIVNAACEVTSQSLNESFLSALFGLEFRSRTYDLHLGRCVR